MKEKTDSKNIRHEKFKQYKEVAEKKLLEKEKAIEQLTYRSAIYEFYYRLNSGLLDPEIKEVFLNQKMKNKNRLNDIMFYVGPIGKMSEINYHDLPIEIKYLLKEMIGNE